MRLSWPIVYPLTMGKAAPSNQALYGIFISMTAPDAKRSSTAPSDNELSEFLMRATHDLRGPLRAIRAHAELLQKNPGQHSGLDRSLTFILGGALQAGLLVDGLTDYSLALQIDPATFQPVPTGVILRVVLAKLASQLRDTATEVSHEELPTLPGNADRLMQLFEYLLDNAMRSRGSHTLKIHISAVPRDDHWLFMVKDNGPGMETQYLDRVFKPFERLHGKERPGPGLAICRAIVERHQGSIWIESQPGAGCAFWFTLPAG